jgi:MFS family permease
MPALLASSVLARLPLSVNSLATVLFIQHETGSFAVAGAVAGAGALGIGAGGVVGGRLVDRRGRRVVPVLALVHATMLALLVVGGRSGWPAAALIGLAAFAGFAVPPTSALLRALYPSVLAGRAPTLLSAVFALDSVATDFTWVVGPLLVAVFVGLASAGAALVFSAAAAVLGTAWFLASAPPPAAESAASAGTPRAARLGALASPGVVTLTAGTFPIGFAFGAIEVAIPAYAKASGHIGAAGLILALFAVCSMAGALIFGVRGSSRSLASIHLWLSFAFTLTVPVLLLGGPPVLMALLTVPVGLVTGPLIASRNELTGQAALHGTETEAYTWPLTALFTGTAVGAAAAGALVDSTGWRGAVLVATAAALLETLIVGARWATLSPPRPDTT